MNRRLGGSQSFDVEITDLFRSRSAVPHLSIPKPVESNEIYSNIYSVLRGLYSARYTAVTLRIRKTLVANI
jgi:hypothetical protein